MHDEVLMERIQQREEKALGELYQRYGDSVYSLAMRVLCDVALAEEVTQDTFLKVWKQPERWNPIKGKLLVWLLTITRYAAIDRLRKENRQPNTSDVPIEELNGFLGNQAMVDDPNWSDSRLFAKLMKELPFEQAQIIQLAFYQGYTHSAIADHLDLPLGTVKTRLRLGLQKLKGLWLLETSGENPNA
jgi:RNA polymerase sigma-70 factor (ECF subfamily)